MAAALTPLAARRGFAVELAHVDHRLDPDSARRAEEARARAARLGRPFHLLAIDVPAARARGESPEAAARRLRYAALERLRGETGASLLLTAHHRDDQVETVLLQIARGVAVERLGGVAASRGALRRPLLAVSRAEIESRLAREGLSPVRDPTNDDLHFPRNRLRHHTLPALRAAEPTVDAALVALGARAAALRAALGRRFAARLEADAPATPRPEADGAPVGSFALEFLTNLPAGLRPAALRWLLGERLGVGQLPSFPSMRAFLSLVAAGRNASLALPPRGARRLVARRGRLAVAGAESRTASFSYTFSIPGEVELPELGLRLRLRRSPVEPWMLRGEPLRAGLSARAVEATVRSRRSGDRLRPLGAPGERKLKQVLIDRGVPEAARDRLPLLEIADELAWIPGVTIGAAFVLRDEADCWLAELEPLAEPSAAGGEGGERKTTK
jgi:tRNA(Ile)-lysidine synthase